MSNSASDSDLSENEFIKKYTEIFGDDEDVIAYLKSRYKWMIGQDNSIELIKRIELHRKAYPKMKKNYE